MAQNCLLGYSNKMDGFGVLKSMLKIVHPILNGKRPSNIPPTLSSCHEIHAYEQSLRNYFQLHKLYNDIDYKPLEKSKQFLHGIDEDQYTTAVTRIRHILDTTEAHGHDLNEDYTIDNLASTIINLTNEYENTTTVVRTMRNVNSNKPGDRYGNTQHRQYNPARKQAKRYFQKAQCHACQMFGHTVQKCTLLPKILAIVQFSSKNKTQCDKILQQHISNNTVEAKKNIVRVLQSMNVIPTEDDSDDYMNDDIIINNMMENTVDNINEDDPPIHQQE